VTRDGRYVISSLATRDRNHVARSTQHVKEHSMSMDDLSYLQALMGMTAAEEAASGATG
jgi:hypothetical protein